MQPLYKNLVIFTGTAHPKLAEGICEHLKIQLGKAYVGIFPDGELNIKVQEDVRGSDVFIIQPTCPPVDNNLMELLVLIDCLKRASAGRITAVIPYYGYARKDRKDEGRVPITAKLVADLIVTAGAHRVLTVDLHAAQIQGFFNIPVDHLYGRTVFIPHLLKMRIEDLVVVGPDVGSIRMARSYAQRLGGCDFAVVDKKRIDGGRVEVRNVIGNVRGKNLLVVDDMIATAGSIAEASAMLRDQGAKKIYICATHAVLCGPALENLEKAPVEKVIVSDSIPLDGKESPRIETVSLVPILASAIKNIHHNLSVSSLFGEEN